MNRIVERLLPDNLVGWYLAKRLCDRGMCTSFCRGRDDHEIRDGRLARI